MVRLVSLLAPSNEKKRVRDDEILRSHHLLLSFSLFLKLPSSLKRVAAEGSRVMIEGLRR